MNWVKWAIFVFLMPLLAIKTLGNSFEGSRELYFQRILVGLDERCFACFEISSNYLIQTIARGDRESEMAACNCSL